MSGVPASLVRGGMGAFSGKKVSTGGVESARKPLTAKIAEETAQDAEKIKKRSRTLASLDIIILWFPFPRRFPLASARLPIVIFRAVESNPSNDVSASKPKNRKGNWILNFTETSKKT